MSDRLTYLKALLKAREGKREYRDSVPKIKAEIAELELAGNE